LTLYARKAPKVLNRIGISFIMVGAANSDSARISFFGSTKRELAQKLVPKPIIISLAKYPTKRLPRAKSIKGMAIGMGAS
jgi:hypothetical protein